MIGGTPERIEAKPGGLTLENQVTLGFVLAIVMLLAVGTIAYNNIRRFNNDSFWSRHTYEVLAAISAMHKTVLDAESDTRAYCITGRPEYLASAQATIATIDPRFQTLRALTLDNASQRERIKLLDPLLARKNAIMHQQFGLRESPNFDITSVSPLAESGAGVTQEMRRIFLDMENEENRLLADRRVETDRSGRRAMMLIASGAGLTLIFLTIAGWMIHRTIGARARSEAAVRASDTMFRGLLEAAPDAMVIVNETGGIEFFNAQAETMFGYTAGELRGQPIEIIIPERYRDRHVAQRDSYFSAPVIRGMGVGRELFGVRKDGREIPVEISLSPLQTPMGLRVSSAIRDVTRRKQEEEALRKLNDDLQARTAQLEVSNRELESFSYSVSHDLRAPLRSIDGFSQALLEDNTGKLDADSEDNLRRVRAASQRMGHLIDDLLNLARVSRAEMNRATVDLSALASEIASELKAQNAESQPDFAIAEGLICEADPRLLRIVLTNLLGNAWKFTSRQTNPRIEFGAVVANGEIEYFVRDNGVGFDMTFVGKLFGAFQRLHAVTDFPGTGIGLATVQRIVHRHGGRVWAESALNAGATFYFTLPSNTRSVAPAKAA